MATIKTKKNILKSDYNHVILRPRITEKATFAAEKHLYTFEVSADADKKMVATAIKALFKVEPVDVRFANIPGKAVFSRGRAGHRSGGRKAYVALRKGDKIEIA